MCQIQEKFAAFGYMSTVTVPKNVLRDVHLFHGSLIT